MGTFFSGLGGTKLEHRDRFYTYGHQAISEHTRFMSHKGKEKGRYALRALKQATRAMEHYYEWNREEYHEAAQVLMGIQTEITAWLLSQVKS